MSAPSPEITLLLQAWGEGDRAAFDRLLPMVFGELRRLAVYHLQRNVECPTLQPTALVNEAYLRLVGSRFHSFDSRRQFFAFASKVLREVLVDYVRSLQAAKRGGRQTPAALARAPDLAAEILVDAETLLALHQALGELEDLHPRQARVVELTYFGGLRQKEIAQVVGCSEVTVRRDWSVARRWLHRRLLA